MPSISYAYVNGRFVPEQQARVSIFDRGFLYGEGCFETMRVYGGKIFRLTEHLNRLEAGLNRLGIPMLLSHEELRAVCELLIQSNAVTDGVARIYQTEQSIVVRAASRELPARTLQAIVSNWRVDAQLSSIKTANRLPYILAEREARRHNADEAVLLNAAGRVVEFTRCNLFVVRDGTVYTPPLSDGPLPGITRAAVLTLAAALRIPAEQTGLGPEVLFSADEVFATNSLIEIAPVANWSPRGELTARLQQAYRQLVREELHL
jgi:branched-chain amino acid aminotransferase